MKNILYSRRLTEKINPAFFRNVVTPLVMSTATNGLGEKVKTYTAGTGVRALVAHMGSTMDSFNDDQTAEVNENVIFVLTWANAHLTNSNNRIRITQDDGSTQDARILSGFKSYGLYVTVKCVYEK